MISREVLVTQAKRFRRSGQQVEVLREWDGDARWYPDPEQFQPERFTPERFEQLPDCAWIPFGAGPRVCIGAAFAMMEMVLVVVTILQRILLLQAPEHSEPVPLPLLSLRPRGGLQMTFAARAAT